jgi:SPP1 family predicted phage head-tail adaptor
MMDKQISLVYTGDTEQQDADGFPITGDINTEILAEHKSVTRTEFYSAMQSGMKPSIVFEIWNDDFELTRHIVNDKPAYADRVEYDGVTYNIIRTYSTDNTKLELICG